MQNFEVTFIYMHSSLYSVTVTSTIIKCFYYLFLKMEEIILHLKHGTVPELLKTTVVY
jgi:hypothetical protein